MRASDLPHVLHTFDTLEGGFRIWNVATDLPINPASPGFDANKLRRLATTLGPLSYREGYDRVTMHSKT